MTQANLGIEPIRNLPSDYILGTNALTNCAMEASHEKCQKDCLYIQTLSIGKDIENTKDKKKSLMLRLHPLFHSLFC